MLLNDYLITDMLKKWYLNKTDFTHLLRYRNTNYPKLEIKSGITKNTIHRILRGETKNPQPETIDKLTAALNVKRDMDDSGSCHTHGANHVFSRSQRMVQRGVSNQKEQLNQGARSNRVSRCYW